MSYKDPSAVFYAAGGGVKVDPNDPAFDPSGLNGTAPATDKPKIYLFSNSRSGDGAAYAMAEDGTVLGSHWCSHPGYMKHDLHDRSDRKATCEAKYPDGYKLVICKLGDLPPDEVWALNQAQAKADKGEQP